MRKICLSIACLLALTSPLSACGLFDCISYSGETKVIAHRGFWKADGAAQNSIKALQAAQAAEFYGSEFDVWITADEVAVINHDGVIGGIDIASTNYAVMKDCTLSNGETLPLLSEYLELGKAHPACKLILEIKPHPSPELDRRAVEITAAMVTDMDLEAQVEYISFSLGICTALREKFPDAIISYLGGEQSPAAIKAMGLSGIDYHYTVFQKNPQWVTEAKDLGLIVNAWTVNTEALMREMLKIGVDFITTDEPLLLKGLLQK
jgi:Glycerophosphoryl diester phosphodiesterase